MKPFNWYRMAIGLVLGWIFVAAYSGGFWNVIRAVSLVYACYMIGRWDMEHELRHSVNLAQQAGQGTDNGEGVK